MRGWMRLALGLSGWAAAFGGEAHAQPIVPGASESGGVRVALGVGVATIAEADAGMAARAGMAIPFGGASLITVRASIAEEVVFLTDPSVSVWDVGVMYGRQAKGKWGYASISTGLALTGGMERGPRVSEPDECYFLDCLALLFTTVEYEKRPFATVGMPFELETGLTFSSAAGIGLNVFGNLNPRASAIGATLNLLIGELR
jgi:hypothetical protein